MKMKILAILLVSCLLAAGCSKSDPRLHGSWKSDAALSMVWNRKNVDLSSQQDSGLTQLFGHMTVTYSSDGTGVVMMEPFTLIKGTNTFSMTGFTNTVTFKVTHRTEESVTIETTSGFMEDNVVTVYFDNPNVYWIYLDEGDPDTSAREYFRKEERTNQ